MNSPVLLALGAAMAVSLAATGVRGSAESVECTGAAQLDLNVTVDGTPIRGDLFGSSIRVLVESTGGCGDVEYQRREGIAPWEEFAPPWNVTKQGVHNLTVAAMDAAGNKVQHHVDLRLDTEPPVIHAVLSPAADGWMKDPPVLIASAEDVGPAGLERIEYRMPDGAWSNYTGPVNVTATGITPISIRALDLANHTSQTTLLARLDLQAPDLVVSVPGAGGNQWVNTAVQIVAAATDDLSGIERVEWRRSTGGWKPLEGEIALDETGMHTVEVRASDKAGNIATETATVRIDIDPPVLPEVEWLDLGDGDLYADWAGASAFDLGSGVHQIYVEGAQHPDTGPSAVETIPVGPPGYAFDLEPGTHWVRIRVTDVAGNEAATPWHEATTAVDFDENRHGVRSPAIASGRIVLRPANVDVAREVHYYIDGQLRGALGHAPFEFTWDTRSVGDGFHRVSILVVDEDGRRDVHEGWYDVRNGYSTIVQAKLGIYLLAAGSLLAVEIVAARAIRIWGKQGT